VLVTGFRIEKHKFAYCDITPIEQATIKAHCFCSQVLRKRHAWIHTDPHLIHSLSQEEISFFVWKGHNNDPDRLFEIH